MSTGSLFLEPMNSEVHQYQLLGEKVFDSMVEPLQMIEEPVPFIDDFDDSPMFQTLDVDDESRNWVSLFSESEIKLEEPDHDEISLFGDSKIKSEEPDEISLKRSFDDVDSSPAIDFEPENLMMTPTATPLLDREPKRSKSSTDHLGVVSYNRKQRAARLSPIVSDESDPVAAKRARNTELARRSRARKMERMTQLEDKVEGLLLRNSELEDEVKMLRELLSKSQQ